MSRRRKKRVPKGGASSGGILRGADAEGLAAWSLPVRCCGPAPSVSEEPVEKEDKSLGSPENCSLARDALRVPALGEDVRAHGLQLKIILPAVHLPPTWGGSLSGRHGGHGAGCVRVGAAPRVPGL